MQRIDKRLAEPKAISRSDRMIQDVKDESHRWRSLDLAFCTMRRVDQILEFLGAPHVTLHLESLTIGPMGSTSLIPGEGVIDGSGTAAPLMTSDNTQTLFQNLNVRCQVLCTDTYPVCVSPVLFSPCLTVLEVFSGSYYNHAVRIQEWGQILSLTPNLIHLRLVGFRHWLRNDGAVNPPPAEYVPVQLPSLERLELSGAFILITDLFNKSTYPRLEYLLLDALDRTAQVPARLGIISRRSPSLRRLSISCKAVPRWQPRFSWMKLLQEVTFFEMTWDDIRAVIESFQGLESLERVRLERIWDLDLDSRMLSHTDLYRLPPIELINCLSQSVLQCECYSSFCTHKGPGDAGSTFSESSAFSRIEGESPSSEESDSDESARSYGEDEGSDMGKSVW
ncbi:hypothetical protein FRC08_003620 [Ceratobasidium sp. 394]|nr:hypothetical protein FRC08_003620 [Ceratobasidium sp. 394]